MPPEACAFCRGLVTGRNQTREYGADEADANDQRAEISNVIPAQAGIQDLLDAPLPEEDETLLRRNPELNLKASRKDCPPPEPEKEDEMRTKLKCPRGDHETDRFKTNGDPAICSKCHNQAISKGQKERIEKKGNPPPRKRLTAGLTACEEIDMFVRDCCVIDAGAREKASDLFEHYGAWAWSQGLSSMAQPRFARCLHERKFSRLKAGGAVYFIGLQLQPAGGTTPQYRTPRDTVTGTDIFHDAMKELQARFDQALEKARQIRETMVRIHETTGVEWAIPKFPLAETEL